MDIDESYRLYQAEKQEGKEFTALLGLEDFKEDSLNCEYSKEDSLKSEEINGNLKKKDTLDSEDFEALLNQKSGEIKDFEALIHTDYPKFKDIEEDLKRKESLQFEGFVVNPHKQSLEYMKDRFEKLWGNDFNINDFASKAVSLMKQQEKEAELLIRI